MIDAERRMLAPAEGARVRKPDASLLAIGGEEVVIESYWNRRLEHGDVTDVVPKPETAERDA